MRVPFLDSEEKSATAAALGALILIGALGLHAQLILHGTEKWSLSEGKILIARSENGTVEAHSADVTTFLANETAVVTSSLMIGPGWEVHLVVGGDDCRLRSDIVYRAAEGQYVRVGTNQCRAQSPHVRSLQFFVGPPGTAQRLRQGEPVPDAFIVDSTEKTTFSPPARSTHELGYILRITPDEDESGEMLTPSAAAVELRRPWFDPAQSVMLTVELLAVAVTLFLLAPGLRARREPPQDSEASGLDAVARAAHAAMRHARAFRNLVATAGGLLLLGGLFVIPLAHGEIASPGHTPHVTPPSWSALVMTGLLTAYTALVLMWASLLRFSHSEVRRWRRLSLPPSFES